MENSLEKVTLRQLQIFLAAAEYRSFLKAAEKLDLTPPAVSMQMGRLSQNFGTPLFEKDGRQVTLTPAGTALLPFAARMIQVLHEASDYLATVKGENNRTIRLAMVTTSRNFGTHLTAKFSEENPDIDIELTIADRHTVIDKLETNQTDLALMSRPPKRLALETIPFAKHPFALITSPAHPLTKLKKITPKDLQNETFLVREKDSGTRITFENYCKEHNLTALDTKEMESNENIKHAVMANLGIAFISRHTITLELNANKLSTLDVINIPDLHEWYILHLSNKTLPPGAEVFKKFIQKHGPEFMEGFFSQA